MLCLLILDPHVVLGTQLGVGQYVVGSINNGHNPSAFLDPVWVAIRVVLLAEHAVSGTDYLVTRIWLHL